jgi:hypothetical protein
MKIKLIDHGCFEISATTVRQISVTGNLPSRPGYEVSADLKKMAKVKLSPGQDNEFFMRQVRTAHIARISQTKVWGKPVWSVRFFFRS